MTDQIKLKGRHSKIIIKHGKLIKKFDKNFIYNFWKESYFLNLLQPYRFVPKLYFVNLRKLEIEMEFLKGVYLKWCLNEKKRMKVIKNCLDICHTLDRLGIRKEEMAHPDRHVIVVGSKPYFIDFERAHFVSLCKNPGNVTQFVAYLAKIGSLEIDEKLIRILRSYKRSARNEDFENLISNLLDRLTCE